MLREVLASQSIGIVIPASLPDRTGIGKKVRIRAPGDDLVAGKLLAVVQHSLCVLQPEKLSRMHRHGSGIPHHATAHREADSQFITDAYGMTSPSLRLAFIVGLAKALRVVFPVLSALSLIFLMLGMATGFLEGWSVEQSLYFSFATGLTIGYGDLVPTTTLTRTLSVMLGLCGTLLTALLAAVAVKALTWATEDHAKRQK